MFCEGQVVEHIVAQIFSVSNCVAIVENRKASRSAVSEEGACIRLR